MKTTSSLTRLLLMLTAMTCLHLLAGQAHAVTLELSWNQGNKSRVTGYHVFFGPKGSNYRRQPSRTIGSPYQTKCTISGLVEGREYEFAVRSMGPNGRASNFSRPVTLRIPASNPDGGGQVESGEGGTSGGGGTSVDTPVDSGAGSGSGTISGTTEPSWTALLEPGCRMAFDTIPINHQWVKVTLPWGFNDPVVVAGPLTLNEDDPSVVRIRNVTRSSFEIRLQEYCYLDDVHTIETVSYLVMEKGFYELGDGTRVEAGRVNTRACDSDFEAVRFDSQFAQPPVVLASVNSFNDAAAVTSRINNTSVYGFNVQMQEQEGSDQVHASESIGYVAWQGRAGTSNNVTYEAGTTNDEIFQNPSPIPFRSRFAAAPVLLAAQQTRNGVDPANLRLLDHSQSQATLFVDEEHSADDETYHAVEQVGYLCLLPAAGD